MSLLLVVVLLFFSSSSSVSSGQYYVSDDCSSVTQSPCNPLSVYAGNMSQYNNTIFYFIGTSDINDDVNMTAVRNVTLHGLDQACIISSRSNKRSILIYNSNHVIISNMSVYNLRVIARSSNNITITNSLFNVTEAANAWFPIILNNAFDINISSSVFIHHGIGITYEPLPVCSTELPHYSLILTNTLFYDCGIKLFIHHGASYNLSAIFHNYYSTLYSNSKFILGDSLFSFYIKNASFRSLLYGSYPFTIEFSENLKSTEYKFPGLQLVSTFVIEDSQFCDTWHGPVIIKDPRTLSNHFIIVIIIMKSCLISNNTMGLLIDKKFLTYVQINITDTKLIGNGVNEILNSNSISLSNVTVANSTSTGLTLKASVVTIENNLIFKHNAGVVGGGLAINGSSQLIVSSSANLEFIDNHASYKGGGIYVEETSYSGIVLKASNIPLTLINNSAGIFGDDIYGYTTNHGNNQFNLTNPNISSTGDVQKIYFCTFNKNSSDKQIYPGQALKFYIVLLGHDYFGSLNVTDGILEIHDGLTPESAHAVDHVYARSKPDSNCSSPIEYKPNHPPGHEEHAVLFSIGTPYPIYWDYIVNECPIGFSIDSSQGRSICACSQSVSRVNMTCNITSLNITHNGLLWIGTYDTSTLFNANANNLNACIINEDCLLYCSPNPVTFQLNHTDTQCVDNRGHRMCGSCTEGYSLLMGSNKCGHCHDNYMMIAWIALFAVMGVLLVVLLIALNLTVSVGTLNGLLFYANIVKLYEPVFSRKGALPVLSQVISWINLDFGFEICLYNGMDSYAKQWLQFAFPLYLWIIIIIIIQLCRRYGKISRLMGSHAVPVLSTLFLFSYTKLVRIIFIVLHKREVTVHCTNESVRSVSLWYEDPNVEYAKGKHAGLFGFALFVSVFFVIPYTLFLLLNCFYEKYLSNFKILRKFWSCFKPIIDAYSGPMKDEFRFWPGLLLVARIPILLSATLVDSFIQSHYFLLSMLLVVLAIVLSLGYCFGGVYIKRMNNIIEVWFLLNLCIMISLSVAFTDESEVLIWYNTCLSVFIFSFILIVVYHFHLQLSHLECYDALIKKFKKQDEDDDPLLDVTESHLTVDQQRRAMVPSSTDYVRRESVVDLF